MIDMRAGQNLDKNMIMIGGVIGCKNDCYKPVEALTTSESEKFHSWQVNQLANAGVDFLIGVTLPEVGEATGIAKTMERTGRPYIISFVIDRNGSVLDGTTLWDAISHIDSATTEQPLCYMVNCSYPTFINAERQPEELFTRLLGCQANSSSLDHADLDGSATLHTEIVTEWAQEMLKLHRDYGVRILGGCCGTDETYLSNLVADKFSF
jgi:S-methylmethionine-dependent homocysteine/selenocysteine methylase